VVLKLPGAKRNDLGVVRDMAVLDAGGLQGPAEDPRQRHEGACQWCWTEQIEDRGGAVLRLGASVVRESVTEGRARSTLDTNVDSAGGLVSRQRDGQEKGTRKQKRWMLQAPGSERLL
jgi:hypothetical protein